METNEMLVEQYQNGDKKALDKLVEKNIGLIIFVVNKYYTDYINSIDREDLIQEGYLGLMRAAQVYKIDMEHKASFSTYAFYWINQKINRFVNTRNTSCENSLDEPLNDDTEGTFGDSMTGEDGSVYDRLIDNITLKEGVEEMLQALSLKEREVVKCRYGFNGEQYTLEETANVLELNTGEYVRQVEARSLRKLRYTPFAMKYRKEFIIDKIYKDKERFNKRNVEASAIYYEELRKKLDQLYRMKCS